MLGQDPIPAQHQSVNSSEEDDDILKVTCQATEAREELKVEVISPSSAMSERKLPPVTQVERIDSIEIATAVVENDALQPTDGEEKSEVKS